MYYPVLISIEYFLPFSLVAFRRGNKLAINIKATFLEDKLNRNTLSSITEDASVSSDINLIPLRAALYLNFDYKNTTTAMLAEQKKVPTIPTDSGVKDQSCDQKKVEKADEVNHIQLIALLHFGNMRK